MGQKDGDLDEMPAHLTQRFLALTLLILFALWCVGSVVWGIPLLLGLALQGQPPGSYPLGGLGFGLLAVDAVVGLVALMAFFALGRRLPA